MRKHVLIVLGSLVVASGCHAGWLKTDQPGIVIQTGGDPSVTTRLAVVEAAVAEMPTRDFNVMGGGLTWSVCAPSRNWTGAALSANGQYQTAVVQNGLIYVSSDHGNSWTAKESPRLWQAVAMSEDGSRQTATVAGGPLYGSADHGNTWSAVGASREWRSVAVSVNGTYQTALEDNGHVYVSCDYGTNWTAVLTERAQSWRTVSMSTNGQYQTAACERTEDEEAGTFLGGGLYVSSDYGATWTVKQAGKDWVGVAVSGDGARQVACATWGKIYVSGDYGNTWTAREENRAWRGVASSADGKMVFGIVGGEPVYVSSDYGTTWTNAGPTMWWAQVGTSGDGAYQIATIQNGQLWTAHAEAKVHGNLTADCALGIGTVGQFMIRGGTQLVFVAGAVTNVLDTDVGTP